jgi:ribonuclease T1
LKFCAAFLALAFSLCALGGEIFSTDLPAEARETLALIRKGGPFPHAQDGRVFSNRERLLPPRKRGYYREYTVKTPGARDRGARRIVAGMGGEFYYTDDHYRSFSKIRQE